MTTRQPLTLDELHDDLEEFLKQIVREQAEGTPLSDRAYYLLGWLMAHRSMEMAKRAEIEELMS